MTTATIESQVAELTKQGATLKEAVESVGKTLGSLKEKLDKPVLPERVRSKSGEGAFSYMMEETDPRHALKTSVKTGKAYGELPRGGIPEGYRGAGHEGAFKTARDFYHLGLKNTDEFVSRYKTVTKDIKDESILKAIQGMSTQTAAEGGAWILPEFSNAIIGRIYSNDLLQRTDGYTVSGNNLTFKANAETSRVNGSRHGGLRAQWVSEGGTIPDSMPRTRDISLKLNKLAVVVYLTDELREDGGPAVEQYVNRKVAEEMEFALGDVIINGVGVNQMLGILNSPALLSITKESGQLATTIVTENVDKMWARRLAGGDYIWLTNQDTHPQLSALSRGVGAAGELVYNPPGGVSGTPYATLKGAPILETEFNATLGTVGDLVLADLSQYITISKGGVVQAVSMHVAFLTDQMALRFTMRVDGRPAWHAPITPYKGSNTQSPFVALATRA